MRKIRAGFMLALPVVASLMAACGSTSSNVAAGCKPADNINTGSLNLVVPTKLTIASDITYPPAEYLDAKTKQYTGADIEIANELAKRLCLSPNIQNVQFNTILAGMTASTPGNQYYDLSISSWTITTERQKQVDMIPYFTAGESLLVPKGNPKHISKLADACGLAVTAETGTTEEGEITAANAAGGACVSNKIKLLGYDTQDQVIQALTTGNADASYQDSPVSSYYATINADKLDLAGSIVSPSPEGIVVRKDNKPFEDAIKQVLSDMRSDGTYLTILKKYKLEQGAING